jgi:hypothetical protein
MLKSFIIHQYKFLKQLYNKYYEYNFFKKNKKLIYDEAGFFKLVPEISDSELNKYYQKYYRLSRKSGFEKVIVDERAVLHYNFLENFISSSKLNFLNIGSSTGGISHLLHKHKNIDIFNLDPSKVKSFYRDRWNYFRNVEEINVKVDFLYMSHSLEHFSDVYKLFEKLNNKIHEKTKIFIEVPNAKHVNAGDSGKMIKPPHIYYFEKKFFEKLNTNKLFLFLTNSRSVEKNFDYENINDEDKFLDETKYKYIVYFGEGFFKNF